MEVEKIVVTMLLTFLLASCFPYTFAGYRDYLDTETVIVRRGPNDQGGLFGYSAVLHSLDPSGGLSNTRVVVGAPLQDHPSNNGTTQTTGAIYSCHLLEDECSIVNETSFYTFSDERFQFNTGKTQLLGISLHSTGDRFVVCSPRLRTGLVSTQETAQSFEIGFVTIFQARENMPGRCFFGDRSLQSFTAEEYCYDLLANQGNDGLGFGQCNIGLSTAGSWPESGDNTFVFGIPTFEETRQGSFFYTGPTIQQRQYNCIRSNSPLLSRLCSNKSCEEAYDGFAVAVGYITNATKLDIITSRPRYGRPRITGLVTVTSNFPLPNFQDPNLMICSDYTSILYGNTFAEYFGWSLVALDLTGDGYDELLVGAPLYSYTNGSLNCLDCGRVYVYRNNETRNLEYEKMLLGRIPFGRFGFAMTSIDDINHDGCDDFVISAPLSRTGSESGTIYLYLGAGPSLLVADTPTQIIVGNELNSLANVISFGSSLSSGYDIDSNGHTDLVVGAGFNETVVVLRARPLFQIRTNMTASTFSVDFTVANCSLSGPQNASLPSDRICFEVTFMIADARKSITTKYELRYTLTADVLAQEPLLFVDPALQQNVLNGSIAFGPSLSNRTITRTIYAKRNDTLVSRNALITLNIMLSDSNNETVPETLVPTILPDPTSITNITIKGSYHSFTLPKFHALHHRNADIFLNGSTGCFASSSCQNDVELRYDVIASERTEGNSLVLIIDSTETVTVTLHFINVENASCVQTYLNYSADVFTVVNQDECVDDLCFADNPSNENEVEITIRFRIRSYPENETFIRFNATSGCTEVNDTDNIAVLSFVSRRIANLRTGIRATPASLLIASIPRDLVDISDAFEVDTINVRFDVFNDGPSSSRYAKLVIYWPLMDPTEPGQFFLYPTRITTTSSSVTCDMEHIDPENLNFRRKRQSTSDTQIENIMQTWDCSGTQREDCAMITCDINGTLSRSQSTSVNIISRYDLRTLSRRRGDSNYELTLMLFAEVDSDDFNGPSSSTGTVQLRSLAEVVPDDDDDSIPIWIIIVAIVVAILIIIVFGIILYCCGFCRRKKRDEEGDDETQKWVSAGDTATPDQSQENSMRSKTLTDEKRSSKMNDYHNDENANEREDSIASEDHDEKSSPPERSDEKKIPVENNEQDVEPESKKEIEPVESDVNNANAVEESTPPDTHIGSDDGNPLETTGTGEGNNNTTTVELACEETDL